MLSKLIIIPIGLCILSCLFQLLFRFNFLSHCEQLYGFFFLVWILSCLFQLLFRLSSCHIVSNCMVFLWCVFFHVCFMLFCFNLVNTGDQGIAVYCSGSSSGRVVAGCSKLMGSRQGYFFTFSLWDIVLLPTFNLSLSFHHGPGLLTDPIFRY